MMLRSCCTHTGNTHQHKHLMLRPGEQGGRQTVQSQGCSVAHLLKQRHGKLLVGYAVLGRADVFSALSTDVEVNTHQEVFLKAHKHTLCHSVFVCTCPFTSRTRVLVPILPYLNIINVILLNP